MSGTNGHSAFDPFLRADGSPRIDVTLLYQPFHVALIELLQRCHAKGADYYPTKGTRPWSEQKALFDAYQRKEGTRASPPGYSAHQFGLAVDCAPDRDLVKPGLQADYAKANYSVLIAECALMGLHNGTSYGDAPHVSLGGFVSGFHLTPLRKAWMAAKGDDRARLKACWAWLDSRRVG